MGLTLTYDGKENVFPQDDEIIQEQKFKNGNEIGLKCESKGSNPAADLSLKMGQKDLYMQGQDAPAKITRTYKRQTDEDGVDGVILSYDTAIEVTHIVEHSYAGQMVACTASVAGLPKDGGKTPTARFAVTMDGCKSTLYYYIYLFD